MESSDPDRDDAAQEAADEKAAKLSHAAIDDAIRKHLVDIGATGVGTGWVLLVSIADYDEKDGELDGLYDTHSDGMTKWAKVGLLDIALHQARSEGWF